MSVKQINIGGNMIGLDGLEEAFAEIKNSGVSEESSIRENLFSLISKTNYIPPKLKSAYETAIYEEYLVFAGKMSARKIVRPYPEIRVYGAGCPVCEDLDERIMKILKDNDLTADYLYVFDPKEIAEKNIKDFPTITINGEIAHKGMVETQKALEKIILSAFPKK